VSEADCFSQPRSAVLVNGRGVRPVRPQLDAPLPAGEAKMLPKCVFTLPSTAQCRVWCAVLLIVLPFHRLFRYQSYTRVMLVVCCPSYKLSQHCAGQPNRRRRWRRREGAEGHVPPPPQKKSGKYFRSICTRSSAVAGRPCDAKACQG